MISAISIYDDWIKDSINKWESGYASIDMFNRLSKRAELAVLDWLSGDVAAVLPPEPWVTQKNKDWLSPFIKRLNVSVDGSFFTKPSDYYKYEDSYRLTKKVEDDCDDEEEKVPEDCDVAITMFDSDKFNVRCNTYIAGKKPSLKKPIARVVGGEIEVRPRDIGSATLQYIRYPKFAQVGKTLDVLYNEEVPDPNNTIDYEWDEWARPALIYFVTDYFSNHTREQALKQFNQATSKSPRG